MIAPTSLGKRRASRNWRSAGQRERIQMRTREIDRRPSSGARSRSHRATIAISSRSPRSTAFNSMSLVAARDELCHLSRGLVTLKAPRHRKPSRQHDMRRAIAALACHDHQVVFRYHLAEPGRAMRQRRQRLEMAPKALRFFKAHRGCGLIAGPGQFTEDRTAAPAQNPTARRTRSAYPSASMLLLHGAVQCPICP